MGRRREEGDEHGGGQAGRRFKKSYLAENLM
jgi:hypothetical protein